MLVEPGVEEPGAGGGGAGDDGSVVDGGLVSPAQSAQGSIIVQVEQILSLPRSSPRAVHIAQSFHCLGVLVDDADAVLLDDGHE